MGGCTKEIKLYSLFILFIVLIFITTSCENANEITNPRNPISF